MMNAESIHHSSLIIGGIMSYSQLIQFKRLEERAFIFLTGKQLMFAVLGGFTGLSLANTLNLSGWWVWVAVVAVIILGLVIGARFRGLYSYQYVILLARSMAQLNKTVQPGELYDRPVEADLSYVLGAPDGGALVLRQAPPAGERQIVASYEAAVYRLKPVDLAQYHPQAVQQLMQRWGGFWAGVRAPIRLLVHSTPFHANQVVEDARAAGLVAQEDWRARALVGYGRFLETLTREAAMYQATHEMVVWATSDTEAQATMGSLVSWLGVSAHPVELTPLLEGEYQVMFDHLAPLDPRQPYLVLLVSHEFSGEWSWADPLVSLLRQSFAVSLVVDVERNLSANEALRELVKYENVLTDVLANARGRDPKAEGAYRDVQLAMAKANSGLALHFTTVVVAVKGATLTEVRQNVAAVRSLSAARLALVVLPGGQGELLKFFTTTRRREINIPEISHNVTSDGMAVISGPLGFRRRNETDGIFWGIGSSGGSDTYPIYWNGFGRDLNKPAAYHGMFLGKSGYGKTVSMGALLYREAILNYVYGSLGQVYNQATNTDVALEANVVTYDFKDVPESNRTLIYTLVLGRIQRIVRSQGRRRRIVAIDEFGWMAQEPILANVIAMWIKTFRTFGCGIWLAEQDLIRLTGGAASGDLSGHSIVGNSVFELFFHHESAAARVVSETFPNMEPYQNMLESFPRPQETGLAEAVLRIPDGAYHMYMLLSDIERTLIGS
jgi:hypothetical protein